MWLQVAILLGIGLFVLTDDSVRQYPWLGFGAVWCSLLLTALSMVGHAEDWESGKLDSLAFRILALVTASIALGGAFQTTTARTVKSSAQGIVLTSIGVTGLFVLAEALIPAAVVGGISIVLLKLCSDKLSIRKQQQSESNDENVACTTFSDQVLRPASFGDFYERLASCAAAMILLFITFDVVHFAITVETHRETRKNTISTLPTQRTVDYVIRDNPSGNNPTLTSNPISDSLEYYLAEISLLTVALIVGVICVVSNRRQLATENIISSVVSDSEVPDEEG